MNQKIFNSKDYENDPKAALKARNAWARKMRKEGHKVICSSLGDQLLSKGGIGTGQPHIEYWTKTYMASVL